MVSRALFPNPRFYVAVWSSGFTYSEFPKLCSLRVLVLGVTLLKA